MGSSSPPPLSRPPGRSSGDLQARQAGGAGGFGGFLCRAPRPAPAASRPSKRPVPAAQKCKQRRAPGHADHGAQLWSSRGSSWAALTFLRHLHWHRSAAGRRGGGAEAVIRACNLGRSLGGPGASPGRCGHLLSTWQLRTWGANSALRKKHAVRLLGAVLGTSSNHKPVARQATAFQPAQALASCGSAAHSFLLPLGRPRAHGGREHFRPRCARGA